MTNSIMNKFREIPSQLEHHFFQQPKLSVEQVVEKLSGEISALHDWLINNGDHFGSVTFFEKSQLLIDKISERDELQKLLEVESKEEIN